MSPEGLSVMKGMKKQIKEVISSSLHHHLTFECLRFAEAFDAMLGEKYRTLTLMTRIHNELLSLGVSADFIEQRESLKRNPSILDFEYVKPISRGAHGRVCLVRKKSTRDTFAMKILRKDVLMRNRMRDNVFAEVLSSRILLVDFVLTFFPLSAIFLDS
jgi:hypothetical protein